MDDLSVNLLARWREGEQTGRTRPTVRRVLDRVKQHLEAEDLTEG